MIIKDGDFRWEEEVIAIESVDAIAVFSNEKGNIVIVQQGTHGDEDQAIIFPKSMAKTLIAKILEETDLK